MTGKDFIYDGISLSSKGFQIAMVGSDDGTLSEASAPDSQRTFNSVSMMGGAFRPFTYAVYDNALVFSFSVCNDFCQSDEDYYVSEIRMRDLKRWLNRPSCHRLDFVDPELMDYHFNGSFNVTDIRINGRAVGASLTFTADAPFGYQNDYYDEGHLDAGGSFTVRDVSDEIGFIYPNMVITVGSAGDLTLTNSIDSRETVVKNCTEGEVLTFTREQQISSSNSDHELGKDFNYKFLRISNTFSERDNEITSSLPIDYEITYAPIAKVGVK